MDIVVRILYEFVVVVLVVCIVRTLFQIVGC